MSDGVGALPHRVLDVERGERVLETDDERHGVLHFHMLEHTALQFVRFTLLLAVLTKETAILKKYLLIAKNSFH